VSNVTVTFIEPLLDYSAGGKVWGGYQVGDVAGFPTDVAAAFIADGFAVAGNSGPSPTLYSPVAVRFIQSLRVGDAENLGLLINPLYEINEEAGFAPAVAAKLVSAGWAVLV
jgi:hypothetical protein